MLVSYDANWIALKFVSRMIYFVESKKLHRIEVAGIIPNDNHFYVFTYIRTKRKR